MSIPTLWLGFEMERQGYIMPVEIAQAESDSEGENPPNDSAEPSGDAVATVKEVIEEVTSFPNGDHDDYVDSMTLALIRFRQGGFVTIHDEEQPDFSDQVPRKREYY